MSSTTQSVQCFGKKRTATAVAHCKVRPMHAALCTIGPRRGQWDGGGDDDDETNSTRLWRAADMMAWYI